MKRLYLIGDVDFPIASALCAAIDSATEECLLTICSGGGDSTAGTAIIASMQSSHFPVHTYAVGDASSAAVDVLYAGATRGLHPMTICMTHGSSSNQGPRYMDMLREQERALYANAPRILENWTMLFGRRKRYWKPAQMQEFGFVDYVAGNPLTPR